MTQARTNLILMGAPGSGKGTQALKLTERFGLLWISTGDILREAVRSCTPLGREAEGFMSRGELVPDALIVGIIAERLEQDGSSGGGSILDGFPRTVAQAQALEEMLSGKGQMVNCVVLLEVPDTVVVGRISGRRSCKNCGASYHVSFAPPKVDGVCDSCGQKALFQRDDDSEEKVRVRLQAYRRQTEEVIPFYEASGILSRIDGTQTPAKVFQALENKIETMIGNRAIPNGN
jgi:adenylate kinase